MGTETRVSVSDVISVHENVVKLNNPQMGTET